MKKITFCGTPACGKSTLSHGIYNSLKKQHVNADMIQEWIRADINRNGPLQSIWEQYRTRNHQIELEDLVPKSVDVMISDCGSLSMFFYANLYMKKDNPRERLVLQDMYRYILDDIYLKRYDLVFYLPMVEGINPNDGTRFQTSNDIKMLDDHMRMFFTQLHKTPQIHCIDAPLDERHDLVMKIIQKEIAS